jgi:uncharacterized protein
MNTNEHPNANVMREFFSAFGAADETKLKQLMADDLQYHFPGQSPISGEFKGVDGLLNGIRKTAMHLGDGKNGFELLHVYADDTSAVTIHRDFYNGSDNHFNLRYMLYVRFEHGKMAEVWEVPFDQAESDRFWGERAIAMASQSSQQS